MAESTNQVVSDLEQTREDAAQPAAPAQESQAQTQAESRPEPRDRDRDRDDERAPRVNRSVADLLPELGEESDSTERREVENGRAYEVTYIVIANNPEALDNTRNRFRELVEGAGGAVDNVRVSETRRFAFPINKRTEGVYVVANTRFAPTFVEELDRFFKLDENVLRHVVLREEEA